MNSSWAWWKHILGVTMLLANPTTILGTQDGLVDWNFIREMSSIHQVKQWILIFERLDSQKMSLIPLIKKIGIPCSIISVQQTLPVVNPNRATMALYFGNISSEAFQARFSDPCSPFLTLWLVQHQSGPQFESALESLPLQINSMLLTYQDLGHQLQVEEVYKIHHTHKLVQRLILGHWNPTIGFTWHVSPNIWSRRSDLQGFFLRTSTLENRPVITYFETGCSNSSCFKGVLADLWHELQAIMNFTYKLTTPEDGEWGVELSEGVWSGIIGQLANDEVDISPVDMLVSSARNKVIDFLPSLGPISLRLIVANPAESMNWTAYLAPLTWTVWIGIGLCILLFPWVVTFGAKVLGNEPTQDSYDLQDSFKFVAGAMLIMRGWNPTPEALRNQIIFYSVLLGGTMIYWHWEAMIISYLAVRNVALPFESLEDLVENTDYKVVVQPGTAYVDQLRFGNTEVLRQTWVERVEPYIDSYPSTKVEMLDLVLKDPSYALLDEYYSLLFYERHSKCEVLTIPKDYFRGDYAFPIQDNSPFKDLFKYHIEILKERGALNQISDRYAPEAQVCPDLSGKSLGFGQCFTAFVALLAGLAVASLALILEILHQQWAPPKSSNRLDNDMLNKLYEHEFQLKYHQSRVLEIRQRLKQSET
ncbi:glutamate receptor ionotropic, kainate glr-3-like [Tigriopus californicus]|uniref:glutamate receptor ionotropic, kainate glr-3-like n=1 Tax=Tigriopus californicus TaxID=6832 RepID=UPI0027DA46CC|nr:glutamate receptor ionotropic, kainate glr-3-like [Tigriopus californicus]